jgi:hypothetical protein
MQKSMLLVSGPWENRRTFKLIPLLPESPYNEGIYDPDAKILALISKETKQSLHMLAKLDGMGDLQELTSGTRPNGQKYAEERTFLDTFYEYYISDPDDIRALINLIAVNANVFDYTKYMVADKLNAITDKGKLVNM